MACYPYDINDDGTATCYNCGGESVVGSAASGVHACPVCGGNAFVSAAQVAYYVLCAEEARAERARYLARVEEALGRQPALVGAAAEEPF